MTDDDDPAPDAADWGMFGDDVYLGGEATVPPEIGGSHVPSETPFTDDAEMRELERRVEQHRTPAFPIDLRRRLPLEALWRRWRAFAMWGRSDVVDDFGRDPARDRPLGVAVRAALHAAGSASRRPASRTSRPAAARCSSRTTPARCRTTARW